MAHILITNDDGIQAEGLRALVQAVEGLGTISVVAPSHERSASAQSLTLRQPIFWEQIAEREWRVEGTPADSVILALNKLLPNRPDPVLSRNQSRRESGRKTFFIRERWARRWKPLSITFRQLPCPWRIRAGDSVFEQAAKFTREPGATGACRRHAARRSTQRERAARVERLSESRASRRKSLATCCRKAPTLAGAASTGSSSRNTSKASIQKATTRRFLTARLPSRLCISIARDDSSLEHFRSGPPNSIRACGERGTGPRCAAHSKVASAACSIFQAPFAALALLVRFKVSFHPDDSVPSTVACVFARAIRRPRLCLNKGT